MLPVRGLKIFEVVGLIEIELLEILVEDHDGIADEEMSEVGR
jgi:hypothetical protein